MLRCFVQVWLGPSNLLFGGVVLVFMLFLYLFQDVDFLVCASAVQKFAHTMYFTLIKCCYNMIRYEWGQRDSSKPAPWRAVQRPVLRQQEADQVLKALGTSLAERGQNSLLAQEVDAYTWVQLAVGTYRDMVARGHKPNQDILDM